MKECNKLTLSIQPGTASPEEIGGLLAEISTLYCMMGGSGITFTPEDISAVETTQQISERIKNERQSRP